MKRLFLVVLAICGLLVLAGCGGNKTAEPNTLRYVLEAEPASIDPGISTNLPSSTVEMQLFEGLTRLDDKGNPQPAAAESWTVSPDGLVYTFKLRSGMEWTNGTPVKASDFEYAWKRVLDPKTGSGNAFMLYYLKNGEKYFEGQASRDDVGVKALDDTTLQVTLENPTAFFLGLTAFHAYYPVPQAVVESNPTTWASDAKTFVGNGPFILKEWKHKSEMVFAKNPKYWDAKAVKLEAMKWPISESQQTRLTLVQSGQADMMVEPPVASQKELESKGLFHVSPLLGTYYYTFNLDADVVKDVRVRKALSMVINREQLVDTIIKGGKKAAYAFVPYGMEDPVTHKDFRTEGGNLVNFNVEAAKALLKEAGYGPENPLPTIPILYNTNELHKAIAEAIQQIWKRDLGVNAELVNQETKVYFASREEGKFTVVKASWVADFADPQNFLDVFYASDNDARYKNPNYNALIEAVHNTDDQNVRMAKMHEAEKILMDDAVVIPIYFTTQPYVATKRIAGYYLSNLGPIDFKQAYIAEGK